MIKFQIKAYKENTSKRYLEIQKQNNEKQVENTNQYNLKTVLDQFSKPKAIGIQDLQNEISQIKLQINTMIIQNQEIETRLQMLENEKIQSIDNNEDKQLEEGESYQSFVNHITKMITKKMVHQSKFFYKPDFYKEFLTLVYFGVDINYVYEGLIPTIYFEKTYQGAVSANSKLLAIHFKISNIHICNQNVCYKTSLLLVKDMNKKIILGTPFLTLLYPFKLDNEIIKTIYKGQNICFKFINSLKIKELNVLQDNKVNLIQKKKQHIKFIS